MAARRKYRYIWDDVAKLEADHCKRWGAFDGYRGPVSFPAGGVTGARLEHDGQADQVCISYAIGGDVQTGRFSLYRQPSPIRGERVYMLAPCCGRRVVSLALLPEGVRCGPCGLVTHHCRRESKPRRAVRSAQRLAAQLGCRAWYLPPEHRPEGMSRAEFLKLSREHAAQSAKAIEMLRPKMESAGLGYDRTAAVLAAL
jgi:hypothetical protein